jgi:hypothetical protein
MNVFHSRSRAPALTPEQAVVFRQLVVGEGAVVTAERGLVLRNPLLDVVVSVWASEGDADDPGVAPEPGGEGLLSHDEVDQYLAPGLGDAAGLIVQLPGAVQSPTLEAVQEQGRAAATPEVLDELAELLEGTWRPKGRMKIELKLKGDVGDFVKNSGLAKLLGFLEENGVTDPEINLGGEDRDGRAAAARAIRDLGSVAATPAILERLCPLLRAAEADVREAAAAALGSLGSAATTPEVLASLAELLFDADWRAGAAAAEAVSRLGCSKAIENQLRQTPPRAREAHTVPRGESVTAGRFDLLVSAFGEGSKRVRLDGMRLHARGEDEAGAVLRVAEVTERGDLAIRGLRAGLGYVLHSPEVWGPVRPAPVPLPVSGPAWAARAAEQPAAKPWELPAYASSDGKVAATVRPLDGEEAAISFETRAPELAGARVRFALVSESGRVEYRNEVTLEPAGEGVWEGRWSGKVALPAPCELVFEVAGRPGAEA